MLTSIFDTTAMRAARTALTGLSRRQEAISANVANIDTPGYERRAVTFEGALAAEVQRAASAGLPADELVRTDPAHLTAHEAGRSALVGTTEDATPGIVSSRNDGNSVSIDQEMTLMVETQLRYQALSQTVGQRIATLRNVIRG